MHALINYTLAEGEDPNAPWLEDSCDFKQLAGILSLLQIVLIFGLLYWSR